MKLQIFDSTLRDGAQGANISFSVDDKLKVIGALDARWASDFIEAGNPFSNPAEMQFFQRIAGLKLRHAKIVAFGSTRRKGVSPAEDGNLKSLLAAGTEYVAIFGKSHIRHATDVLKATPEENLAMIGESVRFLTEHGKKVVFDAEHFFGRVQGGCRVCDARARERGAGGRAHAVFVRHQRRHLPRRGGAHHARRLRALPGRRRRHPLPQRRRPRRRRLHRGGGCGARGRCRARCSDSASGAAMRICARSSAICSSSGATRCIPPENLKEMYGCAMEIAETANAAIRPNQPYVGMNAFAHKAGMHARTGCSNILPPSSTSTRGHRQQAQVFAV